MTPGLTSVVIPCRDHGAFVVDAIGSALAQTSPVEVIVVDDGSVGPTRAFFEDTQWPVRESRLRVIRQAASGVSAARNRGILEARGEFIMFLDADDVVAPTKVAEQLVAFTPEIGWVLCDVEIVDEVNGRRQLASDRYRYPERRIGGWMREQLAASNFIPVMSPLVRRSLLTEDVRFSDTLTPEDWHFWYRLASYARCRYVPSVLATYRKRRGGRHNAGLPNIPPSGPIVLNLGCGTPGALSWHPIPGAVNLDKSMGWCFEDGLGQFADGSVDGITVSHALMYLQRADLPGVMAEFFRVLKPGGIVRITEDDSISPLSSRHGGWKGSEPAVILLDAKTLQGSLEAAGFAVHHLDAVTTRCPSRILIQAQHGQPPDVFFLEGVKP